MASVDVDFDEKTARVTMQQDKALLRSQCDEALSRSGYTVLEFSRDSGATGSDAPGGGASEAGEAAPAKS